MNWCRSLEIFRCSSEGPFWCPHPKPITSIDYLDNRLIYRLGNDNLAVH